MTNPTWEDRDLPVLRAIVEITDADPQLWEISPERIAEYVGFDVTRVKAALWALAGESPPFFDYTDLSDFDGRDIGMIRNPTGHARRAVGTWPTPEALADRLVQAIAQAADRQPDQETRSGLKKMAAWLGSAGRDVAVDITSSVIAKSTGVAG